MKAILEGIIVGLAILGLATLVLSTPTIPKTEQPSLTYDDGFNDGVSAILLLCNQDKEVHLTSSDGDILLKCNVVNPI